MGGRPPVTLNLVIEALLIGIDVLFHERRQPLLEFFYLRGKFKVHGSLLAIRRTLQVIKKPACTAIVVPWEQNRLIEDPRIHIVGRYHSGLIRGLAKTPTP